jgi:hypothetical protein
MSDDYFVLVPRDPRLAASSEVQQRVLSVLRRIAPDADDIACEVSKEVRFHDAGSNFETVHCPHCAQEIGLDWWQDRMDDDADGDGFRLDRYLPPCCGKQVTLNELRYDSPQAFAQTSWTAQNANIGELSPAAIHQLESAAGTALAVVYQHI